MPEQTPHEIKRDAMARVHQALGRIANETRLKMAIETLQNTVDRKSADGAVHKWANLTLAELTKVEANLSEIRAAVEEINGTVNLGTAPTGPLTIGG